jgi:LmbE family N-acetylglucosaminyl deacetylase
MWYRPIDRMIGRTFAAIWTAVFAVSGRTHRRRAARLAALGGQTVWIVSPHPDDEVIGCAFAMLRHASAGDRVVTIFVTDGRGSRAHGLKPSEMAREREREAAASQSLLGLSEHRWLGLREGAWETEELVENLRALATAAPDIVYAPSRVDFHPEHHKVAHAVAQFLEKSACGATVRIVQIHVPMTSLLVNLVAGGEGLTDTASRARAAYRTQAGSIERTSRMRRYAGAFHHAGREAEEYWEMPAAAYARLHGDSPQRWKGDFSGVRHRAWSDPIRYLAGRGERKRLRARADADTAGQ